MHSRTLRFEDLQLGITAQMDDVMGPHRDLACAASVARNRYLICSTPRSGSTALCNILMQSGIAGSPFEYLNPRQMAGWLRRTGGPPTLEVNAYLNDIESRRTSPNGVFGMKVHYDHLLRIWGQDVQAQMAFLNHFDHLFFLRRRDKLAQAVSLYRAQVTQVWSSEDRRYLPPDDPRLTRKVAFSPGGIGKALASLAAAEEAWLKLLDSTGRKVAVVDYESFVADMAGLVERVLRHIGLESANPHAMPVQVRQGSDADPLLRRFRQYIGLEDDRLD